jgi:hypothetical protein
MFGFGNRNTRGRVRNDTFGGSRMRNAALAGVGMLAWRWWRNRQASGPTTGTRSQNYNTQNFQDTPYAGSSSRAGDVL